MLCKRGEPGVCVCVQFYLEPRDRIKRLQDEAADKQRGRLGFFTTNIGQSMQLTGWPCRRLSD